MRPFRRVLALLVLVACPLLFASPASSLTIPGCEGTPSPYPESASEGVNGLLTPEIPLDRVGPIPSFDRDADPVRPKADIFYEYGVSGQFWHVITTSCVDKMSGAPISAVSSIIWTFARAASLIAIRVYELAVTGVVIDGLSEFVIDSVIALRDGFWRPLVPSVVMLGAVWMGWTGLVRRRVTLTVQGAAWMVGGVVLALWVLGAPEQAIRSVNSVSGAGDAIARSVTGLVPGGDRVACPPERTDTDAPGLRRLESEYQADQLWSGLVCRPWLAGAFGSGPRADAASAQYGIALLSNQSVTRTESHYLTTGEITEKDLVEQKIARFENLAEDMQENHPSVYPMFSGEKPSERLGVAFLALIAALLCGGFLFLVSLLVIVAKLGFFVLLLLAPFFLLVGLHPGAGRIYLVRWVEATLGILVYQIVFSLMVMLLVRVYLLVLSSALPWGMQIVVLLFLAMTVVLFRKRVARIFTVARQTASPRVVVRALTGGNSGSASASASGASAGSGESEPSGSSGETAGVGLRRLTGGGGESRWSAKKRQMRAAVQGAASGAARGPAGAAVGAMAAVAAEKSGGGSSGSRGAAPERRPEDAPPLGRERSAPKPPPAPASDAVPSERSSPPPVRQRGQTWGDVNQAGTS